MSTLVKLHPKYSPILKTGRTSCSSGGKGKGCNFQQLPRDGAIRNLFKAREGYTFLITDYSTLELCTLAQVCYDKYGTSVMRSLINDGKDLHKYYASILHSCTEDEVTKAWRQEAKAANFGFPGGLGIDTFITFSKGYGLELTIEQAREMKKKWFVAFPEIQDYLEEDEEDEAVWTLTGRKRARATYCARKNTPFQGLAADGAKVAMWNLIKEGLTLRGFVHDEVISEVKLEDVDKFVAIQEKIMIDSMSIVCPDVKISVETTVSPVYCK
jgi:DNA polymerase I